MDVDDDVTDDTLSPTANAGAKRSRATSGTRASAAAESVPIYRHSSCGATSSAQAVHAPAKPARRSARQQAALGKVLKKFDL
jgi:hypothetical protein